MSCGLCGSTQPMTPRYKLTLHSDGSTHMFLTQTEAMIYSTQHGGGTIETVKE